MIMLRRSQQFAQRAVCLFRRIRYKKMIEVNFKSDEK